MAGMYWPDQISQRKLSVWGTPAGREEPAEDESSWLRRVKRNGPATTTATTTRAPSHLSAVRRCPYWAASTTAPINRQLIADSSAVTRSAVNAAAATTHTARRRRTWPERERAHRQSRRGKRYPA